MKKRHDRFQEKKNPYDAPKQSPIVGPHNDKSAKISAHSLSHPHAFIMLIVGFCALFFFSWGMGVPDDGTSFRTFLGESTSSPQAALAITQQIK
jgi:hypothetical protein